MTALRTRLGRIDRSALSLASLASGRPVILRDDTDAEALHCLVAAASLLTVEITAFFVRLTGGIVCAALRAGRIAELGLPLLGADRCVEGALATSVDHYDTTTGVSASDRTVTLRALADPATRADDLRRPGHVFPVCSDDTRLTADLAAHALRAMDTVGLPPAAAIGVLVADDGSILSEDGAEDLTALMSVPILHASELYDDENKPVLVAARGGA